MCPHKMAGQLESYMVREQYPKCVPVIAIGKSVCSGVLVCSGISTNRSCSHDHVAECCFSRKLMTLKYLVNKAKRHRYKLNISV